MRHPKWEPDGFEQANGLVTSMRSLGDERVPAILAELRGMGSERDRAGMARYGINVQNAFGVSIYKLRKVAKRLGMDHDLALALWATGSHEARLLACFVDDPAAVTAPQMEAWARDFDSWDICDQATTSLFDQTQHAWSKATDWATRDEEWIKRAGFALMAGLAVHDKAAPDRAFVKLLPVIERGAFDERNFVRKAVNWALRNFGGDMNTRSSSRLAILPNTTHVTLMQRMSVIVPMVNDFLDAKPPEQ